MMLCQLKKYPFQVADTEPNPETTDTETVGLHADYESTSADPDYELGSTHSDDEDEEMEADGEPDMCSSGEYRLFIYFQQDVVRVSHNGFRF